MYHNMAYCCTGVCVLQIFLVIEIVWPILLFVILAGMRSEFPAEDRGTGELFVCVCGVVWCGVCVCVCVCVYV